MLRLIFFTLCFAQIASVAFGQDSARVELRNLSQVNSSLEIQSVDTVIQVDRYKKVLDSTKKATAAKIDSLTKLKLPTHQLRHRLDSLNKIDPLKTVKSNLAAARSKSQQFSGKFTNIENRLHNNTSSLVNNTESSLPLANIPGKIPSGTNVPGIPLSMPQLNIPTVEMPATNTLLPSIKQENLPTFKSNLQQELPTFNPGKTDINSLKNVAPQNSVTNELNDANKLSQKADGVTNEVSGAVKGDSASLKKVGSRIEAAAKNTKGVQDLQVQDGKLSQYKNLAAEGDKKEVLEKEALQRVRSKAVNHFAGQEQLLNSAMGKIAELKKKYEGLQSLTNLPKRRNELHGKPFFSRMISGLSVQILKTGKYPTTDFNPWIGYRMTGHITVGGGWNERFTYSHWRIQRRQKVYGPRLFADYKIKERVWLHTEVEVMNSLVPPDPALVKDRFERKWVTNFFGGLKTEFKIYKSFKGYAQILYNLNSVFSKQHINLYGDPLTARIGFQLPFKR